MTTVPSWSATRAEPSKPARVVAAEELGAFGVAELSDPGEPFEVALARCAGREEQEHRRRLA